MDDARYRGHDTVAQRTRHPSDPRSRPRRRHRAPRQRFPRRADLESNPIGSRGSRRWRCRTRICASRELERCVKDLGFVGALVNGFSQIGEPDTAVYYDLKQFWPFWGVVESLGVPFYLHPRNPLPSMAQIYEGHPWLLGPTWAFGQETAVHALRLMCSGLFDAYPELNHRSRPHGRGAALQHVAHRPPQRLDRMAARWSGGEPRAVFSMA